MHICRDLCTHRRHAERERHAAAIMNGEIPAVMINGMGKANPPADEVATEYRHD
jgi:hypothetical protein